jgi:hypothetical protein
MRIKGGSAICWKRDVLAGVDGIRVRSRRQSLFLFLFLSSSRNNLFTTSRPQPKLTADRYNTSSPRPSESTSDGRAHSLHSLYCGPDLASFFRPFSFGVDTNGYPWPQSVGMASTLKSLPAHANTRRPQQDPVLASQPPITTRRSRSPAYAPTGTSTYRRSWASSCAPATPHLLRRSYVSAYAPISTSTSRRRQAQACAPATPHLPAVAGFGLRPPPHLPQLQASPCTVTPPRGRVPRHERPPGCLY